MWNLPVTAFCTSIPKPKPQQLTVVWAPRLSSSGGAALHCLFPQRTFLHPIRLPAQFSPTSAGGKRTRGPLAKPPRVHSTLEMQLHKGVPTSEWNPPHFWNAGTSGITPGLERWGPLFKYQFHQLLTRQPDVEGTSLRLNLLPVKLENYLYLMRLLTKIKRSNTCPFS